MDEIKIKERTQRKKKYITKGVQELKQINIKRTTAYRLERIKKDRGYRSIDEVILFLLMKKDDDQAIKID